MKLNHSFDPDTVQSLNEYQRKGEFHPFTCPYRGDSRHRGEGVLVATKDGWICPYCDYTQDWHHEFMADK